MTGNVLKEIEENIKDYEEQGIEQIPLSLVKYWISVLGKDNMNQRRENTKIKLVVKEIVKDLEQQSQSQEPIIISESYPKWIKDEIDLDLYSKKIRKRDYTSMTIGESNE